MAIRRIYKKRFKGVVVKSGYVYVFKYSAWRHDPKPTVIIMYALEGTHPNTGNQFRFFQGINFSYVPRAQRRQFARMWKETMERSNGNVRFTWETVKRRYPFVQNAVRRYFFKPNYYITDIVEVPMEDLEKVVVSTWSKDFSKKIKLSLLGKFKQAMRGIRGRR